MNLFAKLTLMLLALSVNLHGEDVTLHGNCKVHFAQQEEAKQHLLKHDRFITSTSRFDRESRLQQIGATPIQHAEFSAAQALPWEVDEITGITEHLNKLTQKFSKFHIPLPPQILLIKTTGKEEGNAAYCRGNAIILPQAKLKDISSEKLERLLAHELFHVLSSHHAELRKKLYAIIGFTVCDPIDLPVALRDRKITNPDAPQFDCVIQLRVKDRQLFATPVLFASVENYATDQSGSFFKYLTFRLMEVENRGGSWQPRLSDNQPVLLDPINTAAYFQKIGNNTGYIIHPDEILADNFVHMIFNTPVLANPEIIKSMKKAFSINQ